MAPVVPDPKKVRSFRTESAFEAWLAANHARASEVWLKVHKKGSGLPSVTCPQALDVALCWGWIDGLRKSLDARSFLQRYTPRRPKSPWSQVNRTHVARLMAAGRMQAPGLRQVAAAKADGRWAAAQAPLRTLGVADVPDDLRAAIEANPRARKAFGGLDRRHLLWLVLSMASLKTPAGRARKIAFLVATLAHEGGVVRAGPSREA